MKNLRQESNFIVVVLSSNFVQRGEPSIIDKFYRAECAINAGADLVLELPFIFSCAAAQDFASGAIQLLAKTKFADTLAFGMENPDYDFNPIAETLLNESKTYKNFLKQKLKEGFSFSKANSLSLENLFKGAGDFIKKPNNLLAVSYLMNIKKYNCNLKILPVKRYNDFKSAYIRENLTQNLDMLPEFSKKIISIAESQNRICNNFSKNLWLILKNILMRCDSDELKKIYAMDEGIENLFLKNWKTSENLDDFINKCVSTRYTKAHIKRRIIYTLLNLNRYFAEGLKRSGINYARVLAFNENGRLILKNCSKNSDIQIITSLSKVKSKIGKSFAKLEFKVSDLYEILLNSNDFKREVNSVLKFA